jgi:hypothetical protein
MKRNGSFGALMTLIVAFAIATPAVYAQTTVLSANVPFAFSVEQSQLPAGDYSVREVGDRATLVQAKDGSSHVMGLYSNAGPARSNESKLVFHKIGDRYFLTEIWTSTSNQGLHVPESRLEKEMTAANRATTGGGTETVIVALR